MALVASALASLASGQVPDTAHRRDTTRTQRRDSAVALSRVEVRASIIPTAGPTIGSGVPARVTVVSGREIEAWEPRLLADVLATQAGVSIYDDLGSPYKLNLSTRGFAAGPTVGLPPGVSVFLDGVRQNEPDAQEVNFDLLPMEHIKRVELLSGTASLLGPNSLGGAINLISDRGTGKPSAELEISGASFNAYSAEARASGLARSGWDYYTSGGYERENGWREATGAQNYNGFLNVGHSGPQRGVSLQGYGVKSRAETAGSLPESIFDSSPETNFTAGDFEDLNAAQLALSGYMPVGRGHGSLAAYFRRSHADRFNVNQAPDPNVQSVTTNYTLGSNVDWRLATPIGSGAFSLRVGVDAAANRVRVQIFNQPQGAGDDETGLTTDVKSPSWDLAGYSLADWQRGRVTLSAGARYDYVRIPFENQFRPEDRTTSNYESVSPRGGVNVDVGGGASLYASVGGSFRAPAIVELGCADPQAACPLPFALGEDPPLDPVQATTYELGGRWARGSVVLSGSVYRTDVRDEIFFVASEQALLSGFFTNLDRTRRDGAELAAQSSMWDDRLSAYANYAWTRATFRSPTALFSIRSDEQFANSPLAGENEVEPGSVLPLVPEHQVKAGVLAHLPRGFALGLDARYIGRQWLRGDEANETSPLDSYVVANARLGYTLGAWEISGIVTNLFDAHDATFGTFNENRQTGALERFLTPLNARSLKLILRREIGASQDDRE